MVQGRWYSTSELLIDLLRSKNLEQLGNARLPLGSDQIERQAMKYDGALTEAVIV